MRESRLLVFALLLALPSMAFEFSMLWEWFDMGRRTGYAAQIGPARVDDLAFRALLGLPVSLLTAPLFLILTFKNVRRVSAPTRWILLILAGLVVVPFFLFASFTLGGGWGGG